MRPDGLYDLLMDAATAPQMEALSAQGLATLREVVGTERRQRLMDALHRLLPELLDELLEKVDDGARATAELQILNGILARLRRSEDETLAPGWADPLRLLNSLHRQHTPFEAPLLPLSVPWLFAAGHGDPSLLSELRREMASADQVDMLVSFITWSGVRRLLDVLHALTAVGADGQPRVRIRVLTTTYIGATELKAVQAMAELPGVEVRISLPLSESASGRLPVKRGR
jgi:hypothetical protein